MKFKWLKTKGYFSTGLGLEPNQLIRYEVGQEVTVMKNIIIDRQWHITPRTPENLKALHAYTRRKFKTKNIFDKRTKAYRYLKAHDSELS